MKIMSEAEFKKQYLGTFAEWPYTVYVFAGSYQQAKNWARENEVPVEVWRYVSGIDTLREACGQIVAYGTYWERSDFSEIHAEILRLMANKMLEDFKKPTAIS